MMLIKIGGGADINLDGIAADLAENDEPFMIIHGANALRDRLAENLGLEKRTLTSLSGYESVYSDTEAINLILMAYAGLRNKRIVELCNRRGINAVGLSGIDAKTIRGKRNPGVRVKEGDKVKIVRDFSGKPQSVNTGFLRLLLENGYVPVLCIPIADEQNVAINSENDDIAACLIEQMRIDTLIQLIEAPGFLDNPEDPASVVKKLFPVELADRENRAEGRMKRKLHALNRIAKTGLTRILIADGRTEHPVQDALDGGGTAIA